MEWIGTMYFSDGDDVLEMKQLNDSQVVKTYVKLSPNDHPEPHLDSLEGAS